MFRSQKSCRGAESRRRSQALVAPTLALTIAAMSLAVGSVEFTRGEDAGPRSREESISALSALEKTVMATVEKISPATVRVVWDEVYGNSSGVIVDPDGIVATSGRSHLVCGSPVVVSLSDGREVAGEALGSSWELGIALVRLDGDGPWPSVVLGASSDVKLGAGCIALGHPAINMGSGGLVYDGEPLLRLGHMTSVAAAPRWMLTSCRLGRFDAGGGLFDFEGRLIGMHIGHNPVNGPAVHAGIEGLRRNWRPLLDNTLPDSDFDGQIENPPTPGDAVISDTEQNAVDAVLAKVKAASVGLQWGPTDHDGCSGTIITEDGYIATCQHHQRPCGEAVKIHLPDGRIVDGKVLNSDLDLDIGLMKMPPQKNLWVNSGSGSAPRL